ncbi:MAG: AgmX/PglI C-terminal domain-containing protein [Labilithrix sp.]|nr:AgmX/PglI C-terminal domain-containing protein [Labilithrix sp.]MCW5810723.1 AgmX/PglI C-terminal domain-containing protein [Labilithrix sp.]
MRSCVLMLLAIGCGAGASTNEAMEPATPLAADLPELEIRAEGVDRFMTCPPPGELGQHWIPPIPPWSPPPVPADAGTRPVDPDVLARTRDRTMTEIAVEATYKDFRSCYRKGLIRHPTQDGRVAIVLRIDGAGNVAKVESYGACELAPESLTCMVDVARRLRLPPPATGSETVTVPATFTSRDGVRRTVPTANDAYTADAYVVLDSARAKLHACDESARRAGRAVEATGTFSMDVAVDGRVTKAHVDPWTGDQSLLQCAARVLEGLKFRPATGQNAGQTTKVIARLNFNPRQGSR